MLSAFKAFSAYLFFINFTAAGCRTGRLTFVFHCSVKDWEKPTPINSSAQSSIATVIISRFKRGYCSAKHPCKVSKR